MRARECVALSICPAVRTRGAPSSLITFTFLCPNDWNLVENLLQKTILGLKADIFYYLMPNSTWQMPANYFENRISKWTLSAYEKLRNPWSSSKKTWNFRIISCLPNEMPYLEGSPKMRISIFAHDFPNKIYIPGNWNRHSLGCAIKDLWGFCANS